MSLPHDPTSCQGLQLRIEALVDGELESAEKASLEEHLETCPGCARQVHLALGIRRELRALPELDAPSHVLEAALLHSRDRESRRRSWGRLWHAPRPAWIALGLM